MAGSLGPLPGRIILASASPRRKELLEAAGYDITVRPSDVEELMSGLSPRELVAANAEKKALHVADALPGELVLGADTLVVLAGEILGKPRDMEDAFGMLARLSGRTHEVLTGVCLTRGGSTRRCVFVDSTLVAFRRLDPAAITAYLADVNPLDKAGAYAAQEDRGRLIERIEGSIENVIGLPVTRVAEALRLHFSGKQCV